MTGHCSSSKWTDGKCTTSIRMFFDKMGLLWVARIVSALSQNNVSSGSHIHCNLMLFLYENGKFLSLSLHFSRPTDVSAFIVNEGFNIKMLLLSRSFHTRNYINICLHHKTSLSRNVLVFYSWASNFFRPQVDSFYVWNSVDQTICNFYLHNIWIRNFEMEKSPIYISTMGYDACLILWQKHKTFSGFRFLYVSN